MSDDNKDKINLDDYVLKTKVEDIVKDRLAQNNKARDKELEAKLAEYADYDDLQTENEKLKSAGQSEAEKLIARIEAAEKKTEAAEKKASELAANEEKRQKHDAALKEIGTKIKAAQLGKGVSDYLAINFRPGDDPTEFLERHMPLMKSSYPPSSVGDAGRGGGSPTTKFTKQQIKDMSPEEFEKNQPAIHEAMAKGEIQ